MKLNELFGEEDDDYLFEMSNLQKHDTGLDKTVWVSVKKHSAGPSIKVNFDNSLRFDDNKNFSVSIDAQPRVVAGDTEENVIKKIGKNSLDDIYDWVLLNKDVLLKYWNSKISTREMLNK